VRRFNVLKQEIAHLVAQDDAFGLTVRTPYTFNSLTLNDQWRFLDPRQKLTAFRRWLKHQIQQNIIGVSGSDPWFLHYIEKPYLTALDRTYDVVRKPWLAKKQEGYLGSKQQFLSSAFNRPIAAKKIELLAERSLTDLYGITNTMSTTVMRTLADGMIQGKSPREVARDLIRDVDNIGTNRAKLLAQTETIRAHAEGQLDAMEQLGVTEVGVAVEWTTSGKSTVCQKCKDLKGIVLKISEAHGLIPRHPRCACSFTPANVGEPTTGQIRTKQRIEAAIRRSTGHGNDTWPGAGVHIATSRPIGVV
jgi:SPP1 gp7 family putative phage head morphogenesis protein